MFKDYSSDIPQISVSKISKDIPGIWQDYDAIFMKSKRSKNCFAGYPVKILILAVSSLAMFF